MLDVPQHRRCANRLRRITSTSKHTRTSPASQLVLALLLLAPATARAGKPGGVYFERSPESTIAPLRDEVQFECELSLQPECLQWRFSPTALTPRTAGHIGNATTAQWHYLNRSDGYNIATSGGLSKLRITVGPNSAGDYQCVACFGALIVASLTARLTLASIAMDGLRAAIDELQPPMLADRRWYVQAGNSVLVKCAAVVSNPPAVWSFYKDNQLVPATHRQLATGTLVLQNVRASDSGTYTCAAVNSITRSEIRMPHRMHIVVEQPGLAPRSAPTLLLITGSPGAAERPLGRFAVRSGAVALLECPGHGNPVPQAVWSRPDAPVPLNRTTRYDYGLQIVDVQPSDAGLYVCRLDNGMAPALVHSVQLDVLQAPVIVGAPNNTRVAEDERLVLECRVRGSPEPDVYWLINGNDTRSDARAQRTANRTTQLVLEAVQKRHAGMVQCFARNDIGEVSAQMFLEVEPKAVDGSSMGEAAAGGGGGGEATIGPAVMPNRHPADDYADSAGRGRHEGGRGRGRGNGGGGGGNHRGGNGGGGRGKMPKHKQSE